jgi:Rrf2 family protein
MRISTKIDYALRAMAELASSQSGEPVKADQIAKHQHIPLKFLLAILNELRRDHLVRSQRGPDGGYLLGRAAKDITLADVMRALEGPLADVHDDSLRALSYPGPASSLTDVWKAVRASLRSVLDTTTVADLASGRLPRRVQTLAAAYDSSEETRSTR